MVVTGIFFIWVKFYFWSLNASKDNSDILPLQSILFPGINRSGTYSFCPICWSIDDNSIVVSLFFSAARINENIEEGEQDGDNIIFDIEGSDDEIDDVSI